MTKKPVISLLTDFGSLDHYVGVMKGVILGICPDAQLVDISHEIPPFGVTEAAFTLAQAWRFFPEGTVHLVVVDPGVGSARRPILAEAGGHFFVSPDNGTLTMVLDAQPDHSVREISASEYFRHPVSQTFHGRDIFAPVAAQLARGVAASEVGPEIDNYIRLDLARPLEASPGNWIGTVLKIDRFGNVITNFEAELGPTLAAGPFEMKAGTATVSRFAPSYAGAGDGEPFVIQGSSGRLEISLNRGNASQQFAIKSGARVHLLVLS